MQKEGVNIRTLFLFTGYEILVLCFKKNEKESLLQNEKCFVWWNMRSYFQYELWEHVCKCYCLLKQFDWVRKSVLVWEKMVCYPM